MLSVKGIYENGEIKLLEPVPIKSRARVIVTILDELEQAEEEFHEPDISIFDDLIGVISAREDGSTSHDQYLNL